MKVICNTCPCLNLDIEEGQSCNLKFKTSLGFSKMENKYICTSDYCNLSFIRYDGKNFRPQERKE